MVPCMFDPGPRNQSMDTMHTGFSSCVKQLGTRLLFNLSRYTVASVVGPLEILVAFLAVDPARSEDS